MKKYLLTLLVIFVVLAPTVKAAEATTLVYELGDYSQYYNAEKFKNELQQEYEKVNLCSTKYYIISTNMVYTSDGNYMTASSLCFDDVPIDYISTENSLELNIHFDNTSNFDLKFVYSLDNSGNYIYNLYDTNYSFKVPSNPLEFKNF